MTFPRRNLRNIFVNDSDGFTLITYEIHQLTSMFLNLS